MNTHILYLHFKFNNKPFNLTIYDSLVPREYCYIYFILKYKKLKGMVQEICYDYTVKKYVITHVFIKYIEEVNKKEEYSQLIDKLD